ncbi:HipA domain-containing protein [Nocardioides nitrophenolicus]|uniref:HipA domain-containing protein n=1 Tax=Nocardioides nitrophenolicus TaxID=60489 RepID=UPI00195EE699|nr:HipA domain-containing protein [Nocardioides nitrophenolicus]MBM7518002.1 serine/threonine protein kinase HipA of HipAB toxin-antitoxin module [Nocardioides nitrophenolicus]
MPDIEIPDRFDRATSADRVLRLHQEDFCQALGRLPEKKYESAGGPGLRDLAGLVRKQMTQPEDDLRALADFLAVNLVAGAPDGHAKNISLILGPMAAAGSLRSTTSQRD